MAMPGIWSSEKGSLPYRVCYYTKHICYNTKQYNVMQYYIMCYTILYYTIM